LKSLPGVAEVASIGGMVKQYQVRARSGEAGRLRRHPPTGGRGDPTANQEAGGSVLELAEAEYMVRASGYLKTLDDFRPFRWTAARRRTGALGDVATIQIGPEMRRGIAELNGEGEVAGGVVILRARARTPARRSRRSRTSSPS
jgi:Cu(I)/Ag(I) efflux system membrane protein CusA/SilA